jgi:acetoacetate decarboxylase
MSKLEPVKVKIMPLLKGTYLGDRTGGVLYRERQSITLQYETDKQAIENLLPEFYKPTDKPIVNVSFVYNNGVDFMKGRGYNLTAFSLSAKHLGERETTEGNFIVVMYENDTLPIITGRELLGVPKLYGDIPPVRVLPDGRIKCEVSVWGHLLYGIEVTPETKQGDEIINAMNRNPRGAPMLGYKYIHSLEGPPDVYYPIATPSDSVLKELWTGTRGAVYYGEPSEDDVALHKPILDAIKSLKMRKILSVSRSFGSSTLRTDLAKRLT